MAPLIRTATSADADSLPVLLEQLGYPASTAEVRGRLERLLATPDSGVLVADGDEKVVGLATFHIFELIARPRPQCRLTGLVVSSDHRREGIGAALVEAVAQVARERNCFRLELTTRAGRPDAVPFYTALGFTEQPHRFVKLLDAPPDQPARRSS